MVEEAILSVESHTKMKHLAVVEVEALDVEIHELRMRCFAFPTEHWANCLVWSQFALELYCRMDEFERELMHEKAVFHCFASHLTSEMN